MKIFRLIFAWLTLYAEANDGAGGSGGGGGDDGDDGGGNGDAAGSATDGDGGGDKTGGAGKAAGTGSSGAGDAGDAKGSGPKTMLEAIERGLSKEAPGPADGKVQSKAPAGEDKGKAGKEVNGKADLLKVPDGLSEPAHERFKKLVNENKTITQQAEQFKQEVEEIKGTLGAFQQEMRRTGATPETLEGFFSLSEAMHDGKWDVAEKLALAQLKQIQLRSGRAVNMGGADPLGDFPDLQDDVTNLRITPERALEIAKSRADQASAEARQGKQREAEQQQQQQVQVRESAISEVQKWAGQMAATDIDYKAKEGKILEKLKVIADSYPPSLWLTRIKEAYADIGELAAPMPRNGHGNPLRGGIGGGGGKPVPKTMHEAIGAQLGWDH